MHNRFERETIGQGARTNGFVAVAEAEGSTAPERA